jgi:hypothetical protein
VTLDLTENTVAAGPLVLFQGLRSVAKASEMMERLHVEHIPSFLLQESDATLKNSDPLSELRERLRPLRHIPLIETTHSDVKPAPNHLPCRPEHFFLFPEVSVLARGR